MQGISRNLAVFAEIRLENVCKFSMFEMNSLRGCAGKYFARAGKYFHFSLGAGNFANYYRLSLR